MPASVFELFKPGVGPSSSHTMGPMSAALRFVRGLQADGALAMVERVEVELLGSLASTGRGHRTDDAVVLGLAGFDPATIDANSIPAVLAAVAADRRIALNGRQPVPFDPSDISWTREAHPRHPNALRFTAVGAGQRVIDRRLYFSTGGGFIATEAELDAPPPPGRPVPHAFRSGAELLGMADAAGLSIPELARANERARGLSDSEINARLDAVWARMEACVKRGLAEEGELPEGCACPAGRGASTRTCARIPRS
jgi:L-serine dehydratase